MAISASGTYRKCRHWNKVSVNNEYASWSNQSNCKQNTNCKQFLIDEALQGVWRINLKYHGNKSYEPTYLKATVYYNYGRPSQKKEIKVIAMAEKNVNRELLSIVASGALGDR